MFPYAMTRSNILRYAIAFAFMRARKIVRRLKDGLTEENATPLPIASSSSSRNAATLGDLEAKSGRGRRRRPAELWQCFLSASKAHWELRNALACC